MDYEANFEDLYRVAYRVAFRMLGRRDAAEDVAQETMGRAYLHWAKLRRGPDPSPWVARVAANLVVGGWRKQRVPPPSTAEASREIDDAGLRLDLHRALLRLPRRQRETLVLRYLADFSEQAVARALGCSTGSVKQHTSRGLAALRGQLGDVGPGEVRFGVRHP